jgi:hypothetical protein
MLKHRSTIRTVFTALSFQHALSSDRFSREADAKFHAATNVSEVKYPNIPHAKSLCTIRTVFTGNFWQGV